MAFLGVGYRLRQNRSSRHAACPRCGAVGELASFGALRTFDVFFLPVLPLGRARVVDLCPRCGHSENLGLAQWTALREQAKKKAVDFFRSGLSAEESEELLQMVRKFDLRQTYESVASLAEQRAGESAAAWRVLAEVARHFGDSERAERALRRSGELGLPPELTPKVASNPVAARSVRSAKSAGKAALGRVGAARPAFFLKLVRTFTSCALLIFSLLVAAFVVLAVYREVLENEEDGIIAWLPPAEKSGKNEEKPRDVPPEQWVAHLLETRDQDTAREWVEEYLARGTRDDETVRTLYEMVLSQQEFVTLARKELARRPADVPWHRSYQNVAQREAGSPDAILGEYRQLLAAYPEDGNFYYLVARLVGAEESAALLRQGLEMDPKSSWIYNALAIRALTSGKFAEALENARNARLLGPEEKLFRYVESEALVALGNYVEAVAKWPERDPSEMTAMMVQFAPADEIERYWHGVLRLAPEGRRFLAFFQSEYCAQQDLDCYKARLQTNEMSAARIRIALIDRDAETAESLWRGSGSRKDLVMALVFSEDKKGAAAWRERAAEALGRSGSLEARDAAAALAGRGFDRRALLQSTLEPGLKCLVLAIVGKEKDDPEMLALAKQLNYQPGFFQHLVARELGYEFELRLKVQT